MLTKKPEKWKKIFCFDICSCHYLRQSLSTSDLSFSQVTSVEKREPRKHFSASAYGLGFKNFFLGTLFSTSVTWEKLKSDVDKLCLRRGKNKYRNKIPLMVGIPVRFLGFFLFSTLCCVPVFFRQAKWRWIPSTLAQFVSSNFPSQFCLSPLARRSPLGS